MSKKKIIGFICSVLAITMVVGSWAYYSSTNAIENQMKTSQYGNVLDEKFTPKEDWQPGERVTKETGVTNTGNYPLLVRIKMNEIWTVAGGGTVTNSSANSTTSNSAFLPANVGTSKQLNATDGLSVGDGSVVFKELALAGWTAHTDGYWYYNTQLAPSASTSNLLQSITLCGDTDMGVNEEIKYYTTMASKPGNNPGDITGNAATGWEIYTGAVPTGTTWTRSVSQVAAGKGGYAGASYVLTITSETLQATKEAVDSEWSGLPTTITSGWGL